MAAKTRELVFFKTYFRDFYDTLTAKAQRKVLWTLRLVAELDRIPETYLKHVEGTDGLYEIRVQNGGDIFRIFCFFDEKRVVVVGNGFQKKTQKTPTSEIERAERIKKEYAHEKRKFDQP